MFLRVVAATFARNLRPCWNYSNSSRFQRRFIGLSAAMVRSQAVSESSSYYILPLTTPVCKLDSKEAFDLLTDKEKRYAHHLARASAVGGLIAAMQTSPESPFITAMLLRLFRKVPMDKLKALSKEKGFTDDEFEALLVYSAGFFCNCGNYKCFGDTKFVPDFPKEKLEAVVQSVNDELITQWWKLCSERMFRLQDKDLRLNFGGKGVTTYLSKNITQEDCDKVNRFMQEKNIEQWNTRVFKVQGKTASYEVRLASVEQGEVQGPVKFEDCEVCVTRGDYSDILAYVCHELRLAGQNAANDNQTGMIDEYIKHFTTGELSAHKDASRHWIKDIGPTVESYIGFIENYRDPAGVRSEFEGFCAAVNKNTSKMFSDLVAHSEAFIERLPWPKEFEKDYFLRPDFTSIDIIYFGGSTPPAGINIPNYDDIRQNEGFKNVYLANVCATLPTLKMNFVSDEDEALIRKWHKEAFCVQVGLHELLGHGSGKLLAEEKDGKFNFDPSLRNPLTGEKVSSWYKAGETWGSKFGYLSSAYEECRAEAVGYYLCCFDEILKIFNCEGDTAEVVKYVNWLTEIRAGLMGSEFYSPDDKKWTQAHCHARFVLTRVVMEPNDGFVTIKEVTGADGQPDLEFKLDRTKIMTSGKASIEKFLTKLQVYKATADVEGGKKLFSQYDTMTPELLRWREIVVARRQPRRLFVQANTVVDEASGDVPKLKEYEETPEGVIQSTIDRYPEEFLMHALTGLAEKDLHHFC